jgi:hypothetical protein
MFMNFVRHICTAVILITALVVETYINERNMFYRIPLLAIGCYIIIGCHTGFVYFTTLVPLI